MDIIKAKLSDLDVIVSIYHQARAFMAANGNARQWGNTYPPAALIEQDIASGHCYVCVEDGQIIATFYFAIEEDATYRNIEDGAWLNDRPYGVLHRVAVRSSKRGVASHCINWCYDIAGNMRIDTHADNEPMRRVLSKLGFQYCGVIYVRDGSPRLAFQKC
ncbi:GNAT family N-acetyltransferase [Shewanella sp.]|uniref:GNAT family N-acetyltransferase n=1 Tax=Shewanella sp. TaxID=50422 RepID=UPI003A9757B6